MTKEALTLMTILLVTIVLIIVGPIFTIMSLNTLFSLAIPINFWTWLSTLWLGGVLVGWRKNRG